MRWNDDTIRTQVEAIGRSLRLTHHARQRMQQRGISWAMIEAAVAFGLPDARNGSVRYTMTRGACATAQRFLPPAAMERLANVRVVVSYTGAVITVYRVNRGRAWRANTRQQRPRRRRRGASRRTANAA